MAKCKLYMCMTCTPQPISVCREAHRLQSLLQIRLLTSTPAAHEPTAQEPDSSVPCPRDPHRVPAVSATTSDLQSPALRSAPYGSWTLARQAKSRRTEISTDSLEVERVGAPPQTVTRQGNSRHCSYCS
jgi:hypothetical protein